MDTVPLDPVADAAHDVDAVTEPITPDGRGTPGDLAEIDTQLLAAHEQIAKTRAEVVRLKRKREAAEAQHKLTLLRAALERFADGWASDGDFVLVEDAVRRDPRASTMPPAGRSAFFAAIRAAATLTTFGVVFDDDGRPELIEGYHPTATEQDDIRHLLTEIDEAAGIFMRGSGAAGRGMTDGR